MNEVMNMEKSNPYSFYVVLADGIMEIPQDSNEKILNYLTKAYTTAFGAPSEVIVLLKNHIQIPPSKILAIKPLSCW